MPLAERDLQPELMDAPDLDPARHAAALRALARINVLSHTAGALWPAIRASVRRQPDRPLQVLDVACGGGDVALGLWRRAQHAGLRLEVVGLDRSPVAVEHARAQAAVEGAAVQFRVADVVAEPLPAGFDAIVSSLFLHHLAWADAVRVLAAMKQAAGQLVVVSDLRRSTIGYLIAQGICRLVTRSPIVHVDGPRSVAGAFTLSEVRELCLEAGLAPVQLKRSWPWRYLLAWERE